MLPYIARRLLYAVLTFFGITIVVFALIHGVPGDPVSLYIGTHGATQLSQPAIDAIRHEHRLDLPLPEQYLWWLRGVLQLDFGNSIVNHQPVIKTIAQKLPNTFELNLVAFLISALIGIPIGLWSAARSGHRVERLSAVTFFLLYSLPSFWVALLLMRTFSVNLRWLPLFGMTSDDYLQMTSFNRLIDHAKHLVLPVVTLSYAQLAIFARFSKSAVSEVIQQDYITTAKAKGVAPAVVMWHHALRNAMIPLITLLGLTIPFLISGSVIVERIFQWDGIGLLYFDAVAARDYPTVLALSVVTAVATLIASVIADVLYAFADPRIRLEGKK